MNIKTSTWRPDTCQCVYALERDEDDINPVPVPVISFTSPTGIEYKSAPCVIHDVQDLQLSYDACLKTNQTKNILEGTFNTEPSTRRILSTQEQDMLKLLAVANGSATSVANATAPADVRNKDYKWSISATGEVEIDLAGFTAKEKTDIGTAIANNVKLATVIVK